MGDLKIINLYEEKDKTGLDQFVGNLRSTLEVDTVYDKIEVDFEWLNTMEDTIRYIDNILRNPNRFIVNEEEIVKIELARRITVESIRHLSKHTNYIQEIDEDDQVKPSKILNINKEESFDTYENRLIYTLIHRMKDYILIKKKENVTTSSLKDVKKLEYQGKTVVGIEKINISLKIDSKINTKQNKENENELSYEERIAKLESDITMLTNTVVYNDLRRKNVALIIPPVKKTNLILKNVNFQYAMKLWDFLQSNPAVTPKRIKENKSYEDTGILKEYINDTFILDYIALTTLQNQNSTVMEKNAAVEEITNNLVERIVELNADLPEEMLKDFLGEKIILIKNKRTASLSEIQNTFSRRIKDYLEKIENFRFEGDNKHEKNI